MDIETKELITGPCLVVNKILELNSLDTANGVPDLVKLDHFSWEAENTSSIVSMVAAEDLPQEQIYATPRIGLTLKNKYKLEKRYPYVCKNYRYVIKQNKNKKGRAHLALSLTNEGADIEAIKEATGSRANSINKWIQNFNDGADKKPKDFSGKALTVPSLCSLYGACAAMDYV